MVVPSGSIISMPDFTPVMIRYALRTEPMSQFFLAGRIEFTDKARNIAAVSVSISNHNSISVDCTVFVDVQRLCFGMETDTSIQMANRRIVSVFQVDNKDVVPIFQMSIKDQKAVLKIRANVSRRTLGSFIDMLIKAGAHQQEDIWVFPGLVLPSTIIRLVQQY